MRLPLKSVFVFIFFLLFAAAVHAEQKKVEIFPEIQIHYNSGNNFRNYWHWNDRPLFMDRSARHPVSARYMTEKGVHNDTATLARYELSGLSPLCRSKLQTFQDMLRFYEMKMIPGFKFLPAVYAPSKSGAIQNMHAVCAIADSPHVFRIRGKMVINSYEATLVSPEQWKNLLTELRKKYGNKFLFVGDMKVICQRYRIERPKAKSPADYDRKVMEKLQAYLDVLDGVCFYPYSTKIDPEGAYGERIDDEMGRKIRVLFLRLYSNPRNKDKLLACVCALGYINPQSMVLKPDEGGTSTLRKSVEAALEMKPDYIIPFEWNEWNENTAVMPTVRKGASAMRILRYYRQKNNSGKLTPLSFDDTAIPNLIFSCRASVKLGERIHCELLNVPDGSGRAPVQVQLRMFDANGKCVQTFPEVSFDPAKLEAKDFFLASENHSCDLFLRPELTVKVNGMKKVYSNFPPVVLHPSHHTDYLYHHLPLREYAGISSEFSIEKANNGFYRISGKIVSEEPLNTVEVMERHTESAALETIPEFDREKAEFFRVACTSFAYQKLQGTVTVPGVKGVIARNWFAGGDHHYLLKWSPTPYGVSFDVTSGGNGTRSILLGIPRNRLSDAEIVIHVTQGILRFKVADILKYGSLAGELKPAAFWRVDRLLSEPDIPRHLNRCIIEFNTLVRSEEPYPVFSLRAVTTSGKRWYSFPVVPNKPSGTQISLPIHSDTMKKTIEVQVPAVLVPDAVYSFTSGSGRMLTTPWKMSWAAEIGGGYHYNLSNAQRKTSDIRSVGPVWKHTEKDGDYLHFMQHSNLTFLPEVWPLGAFTFECEIRPEKSDCILLRHGNPKQNPSFSILFIKGKITLWYGNTAAVFRRIDTPLELKLNEWNTIKVSTDMKNFFVTVNGKSWQGGFSGRRWQGSGLVIGSDDSRYPKGPAYPDFSGDMRKLRISHKFEE